MKLKIENHCIRCGICITLFPDLFEMDFKEDIVRIREAELSESLVKKARQSIKDCAVTAIVLCK